MSRRRKDKTNLRRSAVAPTGRLRAYGLYALAPVLLATFLIYLPALKGSRIWDDEAHITKPELQSLSGLSRIWFELGATQQYYPLLHSAFWIEHKLWGDSVIGYHLVNVLWHMLAVVLVYLILQKLKIPGALLAAAVFAVHPVMVESVAWISEQKNTLSAVFYLAAMFAYLDFDESRKRSRYLLALGLFVLGLLTKTVTATLPAALLVIFWWQRGTLSWQRDVRPLTPFFLLGAMAGALTAWVERKLVGAEGGDFELTLLQRGLLAGRVVWFYLGKLLWPENLIFIYPRWHVDPTAWWQWLYPVATLALLVLLWALRRQSRGPLAGWLLFVGTLFPALGFLNVYPFIYSFVADHFQYLASLGMIVLASSGIALGLNRLPQTMHWAGATICVILVGALAALSARQAQMYRDCVGLYEATLTRNPGCWMARNNLGAELFAKNQLAAALDQYRAALLIKPEDVEILNHLGIALIQAGRLQEAIESLNHALSLRPDYVEAHGNLGLALTQIGRIPEGIEQIRQAVKLRPNYAEAHGNLASALTYAGRLPEAIDEFRTALALNPNNPIFHNNISNALVKMGRFSEAREYSEQALRLQPDFAEAHYGLGTALAGLGDLNGAISHFEQALRLRPDFADVYNSLGELYRQSGHPQLAIEQFQAALQLNPDFAAAHDNLGIVLVAAGNMPQAIDQFRNALKSNPNDANAHGNLGTALITTGNLTEGITHCEEAVRLQPDSATAHNSLGQALHHLDRTQQAIEHFQAAVRLQPDFLPAYTNLARALSSLNRSDEAIAISQRGIEVARSTGRREEAASAEDWLTHYRAELQRTRDAAAASSLPSAAQPTKIP